MGHGVVVFGAVPTGEIPVTLQDEQTHKCQPLGVLSLGLTFDPCGEMRAQML